MLGVKLQTAPLNGVERQVVPGTRAGKRHATSEVSAARCAYDFMRPHSGVRRGDDGLLRGGIAKVIGDISSSRADALFYFLEI